MTASILAMLVFSLTLDDWVAAHTAPKEEVLCRREVNGEYFFIARTADGSALKFGSRIDVSAYRPGALSLKIDWTLRGQGDALVRPKISPAPIKNEYVTAEGKRYSHNVIFQTLKGMPTVSRVTTAIEKCPARPCVENPLWAKYTVELCEIATKQK